MRATAPRTIKRCVICGKLFHQRTWNQKTCDEICRSQVTYYKPKGEHKGTCEICGKEFITRQKRRFCSDHCRAKAHDTKVFHEAICANPLCCKPFQRSSRKKRYCSDACNREARAMRDSVRRGR